MEVIIEVIRTDGNKPVKQKKSPSTEQVKRELIYLNIEFIFG